jgi:hypothetical protein
MAECHMISLSVKVPPDTQPGGILQFRVSALCSSTQTTVQLSTELNTDVSRMHGKDQAGTAYGAHRIVSIHHPLLYTKALFLRRPLCFCRPSTVDSVC